MLRAARAGTIAGGVARGGLGVACAVGADASRVGRGRAAAQRGSSAALRYGVFEAGMASARDPAYTVVPQRERMAAREQQAREQRARDDHAPQEGGTRGPA